MFFASADPYLNIDAGTMSPFEHGEVFVLDDGGEVRPHAVLSEATRNIGLCQSIKWFKIVAASIKLEGMLALQADLDLGNYERFVDVRLTRDHNITTGKIYQVRPDKRACC